MKALGRRRQSKDVFKSNFTRPSTEGTADASKTCVVPGARADSQMTRQNSGQRPSIHQTPRCGTPHDDPSVHSVGGPRARLAHSTDARDPGTQKVASVGRLTPKASIHRMCHANAGVLGRLPPSHISPICMSGYVNGPNLGASALLSKLPSSMCMAAEMTQGCDREE